MRLEASLTVNAPIDVRLWKRVDKNGPVPIHAPELGPCWLWMGLIDKDGYGQMRNHYTMVRVHRLAYELQYDVPPGDNLVCHKCDVKRCIRGSHLYLGDHQTNAVDMYARGQGPKGERHGSKTHPERVPRGERHGWRTHPEAILRGSAHPTAKLTEAAVLEMRRRYAAKEATQYQLAAEFGVGQATVWRALKGKCWTHV